MLRQEYFFSRPSGEKRIAREPATERLPSGKHRHLKKKELLEKVKAEAELRFALDPKQSEGDEPSPKRRRC